MRNARDIVIRQTLSDRFIAAFRQQISENPHYRSAEDTVSSYNISVVNYFLLYKIEDVVGFKNVEYAELLWHV